MRIPKRLEGQAGRHALVDGIPFALPVNSERSPALIAVFSVDAERAAQLLPGHEVHPLRVSPGRGALVVTVIDYRFTDIGRYVEFSIAIACTHGERPGPPLLPVLLQGRYGTGQFVIDLPVSSEVSVKGGKGIWGMPKHQANLDFEISERKVSSQYDLDGRLAMRIEVKRPLVDSLPIAASAANYCQFRGMLMRSWIYFRGRGGVRLPFTRSAKITIGDHPRVAPLKDLDIADRPLVAGWMPETSGTLDDHFEGWFLSYEEPPTAVPEGLESVVGLGQGQEWLAPPDHALSGDGSDERAARR